ncbi:MAG TPA: phospholipase D-like domain-containing protein, partial [Hanamia sp.]|nr:phospholipase D-like domain-containing protein [Hanamia sp.]
MEKFATKNGVSVRAYKGDAMTLLAFDLNPSLKKNLAGFSISYKYKSGNKWTQSYLYNRMKFPDNFFTNNPGIPSTDKNSTLYSPIQKFNWVHVPETDIDTQAAVFANYAYQITPRYIVEGILQPLRADLTVTIKINVTPFDMKKTKIGFTRGFVSSVAYAKRFNVNNNHVRPAGNKNELLFDITQKADSAWRWNDATRKYVHVDYTFEEQHKWLGWQARQRILDFLDEAVNDKTISVKSFAYDLDEPEICKRLLTLAAQNRLKMILDDAGKHGNPSSMETTFADKFKQAATDTNDIQRGHYLALAHSKVFIQLKKNKAVKVLTGSANFSTNGLYINSNHVIIFDNKKMAQLYSDVFDDSFGDQKMKSFKGSQYSIADNGFDDAGTPSVTITFAPHKSIDAKRIFDRISKRILKTGNTDVLFAIMKDTSKSSILDAVQQQVKNDKVFTYGITDTIADNADYSVFLYKPNSLKGIRVAARGIQNVLPKPFGKVAGVDGYAIHHKFIVVNFKGNDPVVYCGSSNLAFNPEQHNGDN